MNNLLILSCKWYINKNYYKDKIAMKRETVYIFSFIMDNNLKWTEHIRN